MNAQWIKQVLDDSVHALFSNSLPLVCIVWGAADKTLQTSYKKQMDADTCTPPPPNPPFS